MIPKLLSGHLNAKRSLTGPFPRFERKSRVWFQWGTSFCTIPSNPDIFVQQNDPAR